MVGIGNVPKLKIDNYKPDGMTPLYDAMGKIINKFEDVDGTVQFVVHTDGIENNSCEFNFLRLEDYIKQMTDKGWLFVYLGEGVDGKNEMAKFRGVKVNFSSQNRMQSIGELSKTTAYYSAGVGNDVTNYSNNIDGSIDVDTGETVK